MSDQDDPSAFDDPAGPEPVEPESWAEEPSDEAWSPVMSTPPPDAEPVLDDVDAPPPPHEQFDDGPPPPPPEPGGVDAPPPPPPPPGELPPEPPGDAVVDPVDLSTPEQEVSQAPMPPVVGDDAPAPPPPGPVDLGADGPPLPPGVTGVEPGTEGQSPVPAMGNTSTDPATDQVDLGGDGPPLPPGVTGVEPGTEGQSPVPAMGDQSPVPPMGNTSTDPAAAPVDLGDGGPPMPPGLEGTDTGASPPGADPGIELPTEPGREPVDPSAGEDTTDTDPVVPPGDAAPADEGVTVEPGTERVTAAAVTGWFLDAMGEDDPARERMIGLVEEYAADGTITMAELDSAYAQAGLTETTTDGTEDTLRIVLERDDTLPRAALVEIDGEGIGMFRISEHGGVVELESLQTRAVYSAEPREVAAAWRESGSRLISAPAAPPAATLPPVDLAAVTADPKADADPDREGESGSGLRSVFLAGAVLLPLAGGGAYLATRKIR